MQRITNKNLDALCERLNRATNNPLSYRAEDGSIAIGHYHISGAYGGVQLHQTVNDGGGVRDVLRCGYTTKRDLWNQMHAYLSGIEAVTYSEA